MHATCAGEERKILRSEAQELEKEAKKIESCTHLPDASGQAQKLREKAAELRKWVEDLKVQARLEDLSVWEN